MMDNTVLMAPYHNIASGRIFILGNGPSLLEQLPLLERLRGEATFCCNSMGRWDALPFEPTYYGLSDIDKHEWLERNRFPHWKNTLRFNVRFKGWPDHEDFLSVEKASDSVQVKNSGTVGFEDVLPPIPTARTTPLTLLQLAAWMGYREFYYLGIEQTRGYAYEPDRLVSMRGHQAFPLDKNPKYQLAIQACAERMRADVEAFGGHLYDCTPGGLLNRTGQEFRRRGVPWREVLPYQELSEVL